MSSIELFAGAGGLAMGMAKAGFQHSAVVEWDDDACQTIRENRKHYDSHGKNFDLFEGDAREFDLTPYKGEVEIISGGPPCQPFSLGGKHRGFLDDRDMFPVAVRAVHQAQPRAFIFENVKGLLRESFSSYLEYILLQLSYPQVVKRKGESWNDHLGRLEQVSSSGEEVPEYKVYFRCLNAANYGVPQKRERVFFVGLRSDLNVKWKFPDKTHSENALLHAKWVSGEYWDRHKIPKNKRPSPPDRLRGRIQRLADGEGEDLDMSPWVTVRDAISDLPDPEKKARKRVANHVLTPGARAYKGHTGSPYDEPSKTLKAGVHGVPGGENMLVKDNGSVRYFTVREAARLQTFPDDYVFHGAWSETMRQLGNAVPVRLAEIVAQSVLAELRSQVG